MKKILVYPCGTEIGLEIFRSLCFSMHYEIYGGSSCYDHGRFVYKNHIDNLPFIEDNSTSEEVDAFNNAISRYQFDYIYPAMDGVVTVFSKYREHLTPTVIAPNYEITEITRSKRKTYLVLKGIVPIPKIFNSPEEVKTFPVFIKPNIGQGSVGTCKILTPDELKRVDFSTNICMEFLPGEEYTVDCFTNADGELIFAKGRGRKRIKNGISVNAVFVDNPIFSEYAKAINNSIKQKGGWFFQLKKDVNGDLKLLEVASRIAGASAITRCLGVNLPLLTVEVFGGNSITDIIPNEYEIEIDRAFKNVYNTRVHYETVYIDYDDTVVINNTINTDIIKFLYQCINHKKKIVLLSKHNGNLRQELKRLRILDLFDEIIHIERSERKSDFIIDPNAIFIDDSYGERKEIKEKRGIPVFDTHMIECLMEE